MPLSPLSDRELEIVRLVACGRTNREIGHTLGISRFTVKTHLERVYIKTRVPNRVSLAVIALRHKLIDDDLTLSS